VLLTLPSRSLLVSLAVLRALTIECRRDLHLFSESLMSAVDATLSDVVGDLEVAARAASVVCTLVLDEMTPHSNFHLVHSLGYIYQRPSCWYRRDLYSRLLSSP
jgi:hypothetical protein